MRAAVADVGNGVAGWIPISFGRELNHGAERGKDQYAECGCDHRKHGHLDFLLFDLLA